MHIIVEKKSLTLPPRPTETIKDAPVAPYSFWNVRLAEEQNHALPVFLVGHTDSVLNDAWRCVNDGLLPIWGAVLAQSQSQGRGQTRRQWHSPEGNVYIAIRLPAEGIFATTAAAPVFSTLALLALQNLGCFLQLKWPNDLVLGTGTHKVGGILLEEKQGVLMAGMGINLQQAPQEKFLRENHALPAGILPPLQGLYDCIRSENSSVFSSQTPLAEALAIYLVSQIHFWYKKKLLTATSEKAWTDLAEAFLLWKGQEVELTDGQESKRGILQGLGSQGEIILRTQGQLQQCTSGSLRLKI